MKIAIFKNIEYDYESVVSQDLEGCPSYIRVTEYVDVDFKRLNDADAIKRQIAAIDNKIEKLSAEFQVQKESLEGQKANLLSLTNLQEGV